MSLRANPLLIELNAFTFLARLKEKYGPKLTLSAVPAEEWTRLRDQGFDAVWLMGVWKRSPKARQIALDVPELKAEYDRVLPGWTADDVGGSAYAIADYTLDPFLGPPKDLSLLKNQLNQLGLKLILDFVPNHVALDHHWTTDHPEYLVRPTPTARRKYPQWFFKPAQKVFLAHGRDPNYQPWSDTAQINAFDPGARQAMRQILERIAEVADGVRCDMAMLAITNIFKKTWGDCVAAAPAEEFWAEVLTPVKKKFPHFTAIAECYWNMGQKLLELGFDAVYDKALYDRLNTGDPRLIREYLHDPEEDQRMQLRFAENHDEARVATAFGREKGLAVQAAVLTLPGVKLFHQDQEFGLREHVPVQLKRFSLRMEDERFKHATRQLLDFLKHPAVRDGRWHQIVPHEAWLGSMAHGSVLSWIWTRGHDFALVAVNFGPGRGIARLRLPLGSVSGEWITLRDRVDGAAYVRQVQELTGRGLYVELEPWKYHLLEPSA